MSAYPVRNLTVMLLLFMLAACSSSVQRPQDRETSKVVLQSNQPVSGVTITLADSAKAKIADNLKFNTNELRDHMLRALEGHELLNQEQAGALQTLEIVVTDVRVRSNFNAVMWGFMAGADSIKGDVVIRGPDGREQDRFKVSAVYALGGMAGGQDNTRLAWLYEAFAKEAIKELIGKRN
jgi:hypothetical protein